MPRNYLPGSDAGLLGWSRNFAQRVGEDAAGPGRFGVSVAEAESYAAEQLLYAQAYRRAKDPQTRGPASVRMKNEQRKSLVASTRKLAMRVMWWPGVADADRVALGLNMARVRRRRIPRPQVAPVVEVMETSGHGVRLHLVNAESPWRRGRPIDVAGVEMFRYVGERPPTALEQWQWMLVTVETKLAIDLPSALPPGTEVWFTARWQNARGQTGPMATPVRIVVGFGGVTMEKLKAA